MSKTFIPYGDLIAVKIHNVNESPGGVALPQRSKTYHTITALVVATGPECKQVKEGDTVLFPDGAMCVEVKHRGQSVHVIPEKSVAGIEIPVLTN